MAYSPGQHKVPRLRRCERKQQRGWYCTRMGKAHGGPCALEPTVLQKIIMFIKYGEWWGM